MYQGKLFEMVRSLCERVFCTWLYTIGHCWHQSEKLCFEPSQIATVTNCDTTVAICDLSQFMIKALTWHIDSNNTENVLWVLGRVPMFTFDMNMKSFILADSGVISLVHLFVCKSVIMTINDVPKKLSWKGLLSMWTCLCTWEYTIGHYWHQSVKLCFEPSQFATVTNCDKSGITTVAICDLSQFVTKTMPWQIQSNNIENAICVSRRVPKFSFDRNLSGWVLTHFRVNCHMYCI